MRALIQRVREAAVTVDGESVASIGPGLLVFLGIAGEDSVEDAHYVVNKVVNLRVFGDDAGRFNRSALDVGAELLVVSQFTLYADTRRGRRPSFTGAALPDQAERLYDEAVGLFRGTGLPVSTGRFAAEMLVSLTNHGPVTILLDSADLTRPRRGREPSL